jgi:hypothetical protein
MSAGSALGGSILSFPRRRGPHFLGGDGHAQQITPFLAREIVEERCCHYNQALGQLFESVDMIHHLDSVSIGPLGGEGAGLNMEMSEPRDPMPWN